MKKKKIFLILGIGLLIIVLIFLLWFYFPTTIAKNIIEKANYCEKDDDCKIANFGCIFGYGYYINKNDEAKLQKFFLIVGFFYPSYECDVMAVHLPACRDKICSEKYCEIGKNYSITDFSCKCPPETRALAHLTPDFNLSAEYWFCSSENEF